MRQIDNRFDTKNKFVMTKTLIPVLLLVTGLISIEALSVLRYKKPFGVVPSDTYKGEATYMTPGLGACENLNEEGQLVAAINAEQYGNPVRSGDGVWCGKCILVKAVDYNSSVVVQIVDRAEGFTGHIVLSATAFMKLAVLDKGVIKVQWRNVPCPNDVPNPIDNIPMSFEADADRQIRSVRNRDLS